MVSVLDRELVRFDPEDDEANVERSQAVPPQIHSDNANYTAREHAEEESDVAPPPSELKESTKGEDVPVSGSNDRNAKEGTTEDRKNGRPSTDEAERDETEASRSRVVATPEDRIVAHVQPPVAKLAGGTAIGKVQRDDVVVAPAVGVRKGADVEEDTRDGGTSDNRQAELATPSDRTAAAIVSRETVKATTGGKDNVVDGGEDKTEGGGTNPDIVHAREDDGTPATEGKTPGQPPQPPVPPVAPHGAGNPEDDDRPGGEDDDRDVPDSELDEHIKDTLGAATTRYEANVGSMAAEERPASITGPRETEEVREAESPEEAYSRFQGVIEDLRARATETWSGSSDPRPIDFQIGDPAEPDGPENLTVRLIPEGNEALRAAEEYRHEALSRGADVVADAAQINLDTVVAYDPETGQMVVKEAPGKELASLAPEEKRAISISNLADLLEGAEAMTENGIAPSSEYGASVLWDAVTGRFGFRDYVLTEDSEVNQESITYATVDAFTGVTEQLRQYNEDDREMKRASDRFRELSQAALREHYFYVAPGIAKATEELMGDQIRAVYAQTLPAHQRLAYDAHVASQLHDLALSETASELHDLAISGQTGEDVEQRLATLEQARQAYNEIVYRRTIDPSDGSIYPGLRTDTDGTNLLITNDHFVQARLALAYMPVSVARIRGEALSTEDRAYVNRELATVLDDMMPADQGTVHPKRVSAMYGHLNEVIGMTLLSRQAGAETPIALPTSEVRRLHAGPDAAIPFTDDGKRRELDIDWKVFSSGSAGAGEVVVGPICLDELAKMENPPELPSARTDLAPAMLEYTAKLLRDEGIGESGLNPDETAYLDRVQTRIWERIISTARYSHGVANIQRNAGI